MSFCSDERPSVFAAAFQSAGEEPTLAFARPLLVRMTATAACLYDAAEGLSKGGGPGSIGCPSAKPRTRPHCAPTKLWICAGIGASPFAATCPSASGCQKVGSWTVDPASLT